MKRIKLLMLLAAGLVSIGGRALGDTGTYRILKYEVDLTPHSDGSVAIQYYQKWHVTGGHIPWITVGTPNGNFTITGSGGAVIKAESASEGGWSGVRLDLDGDYREGDTFEASFSIVQRGRMKLYHNLVRRWLRQRAFDQHEILQAEFRIFVSSHSHREDG